MIIKLIGSIIGSCFLGIDFDDAYTLISIVFDLRKTWIKYINDKATGKKHTRKTENSSE